MDSNAKATGADDAKGHSAPAVVWFRDDLRVADNPALDFASASDRPIIALFILETGISGQTQIGAAQKWMLHHALVSLADKLNGFGVKLMLRKGNAADNLKDIIERHGATSIYWNRRYDGHGTETDRRIKSWLSSRDMEVKSFRANLLHEPQKLLNSSGKPYRVYTPFWHAVEREPEPREPIGAPTSLHGANGLQSLSTEQLDLLPKRTDWAGGLRACWNASEDGAWSCLEKFIENGLRGYAANRDFPSRKNVSRLSPYLRFGMISPFQVWHAVRKANAPKDDIVKFLKELAWREFSYHLLFHFPEMGWKNFNPDFDSFPFRTKLEHLKAWQQGKTGYPIVDAGMRELWRTGYMHNRVRMVAASFLVKHLLIDWREGERWFWDTLVDGDPANNAAGWQWVAGSGADAAPYFRIFNPVIQGRKFDPSGSYVSKWLPELSKLPLKYLHAPWQAPAEILEIAGITPGKTYPHPIVDHQYARTRALRAFAAIRKDSSA